MVDLNTSHPKFCMAMELLVTLPPPPNHVPLRCLAEDLGMDSQADVRQLLSDLEGRGYKFESCRSPVGGNSISVKPSSWLNAKRDAEAYWNLVYAD